MTTSAPTAPLLSDESNRQIIEALLWGAQRARSIIAENADLAPGESIDDDRAMQMLNPWLIGKRSIVPTLADLSMASGPIEPTTILNLCSIAAKDPMFLVCAGEQYDIPSPADIIAAMQAR